MKPPLKMVGVMLRKDLLQFWQLVMVTIAINTLTKFPGIVTWFGLPDVYTHLAGQLLGVAGALATGLLILFVFHEDAVVGAKRDWLTRPVPGMVMLASKCVFVVLFVLLPWVLAVFLSTMFAGYPPGEALVTGVADALDGKLLMFFLCVMAVAALTANMLQAIVTLLACTVVGVYTAAAVFSPPAGDSLASGYYLWMRARPVEMLLTLAAMAVLWIQYRRHRGHAALVLVGVVALAVGTFLFTLSTPRMFGLQKRLSPEPAVESLVAVSLASGCFATQTMEGRGVASVFPEAEWARLGDDAIAFAVRLVVDRLPQGGRLALNRAELAYRTADGGTVSLGKGQSNPRLLQTESGLPAMDRYWMLSKEQYRRLAADPFVTMHIDYSLSVMTPVTTAALSPDGRREFHEGIGYCGAKVYRTAGEVNCYLLGDQPALLVARIQGQPESESHASGTPDFAPAMLDFWGGQRHHIPLRVNDASVPGVQVTAYEARAHFSRRFDVPGVLGGPVSACPLP